MMMNDDIYIGKEFKYYDNIAEEFYNVIFVGADPMDQDGFVFVYYMAKEEVPNEPNPFNTNTHPVHGKYWICMEAGEAAMYIVDANYEEAVEEVNTDEVFSFYGKDL